MRYLLTINIVLLFLLIAPNGYSGTNPSLPPVESGCCQFRDSFEGFDEACAQSNDFLLCSDLTPDGFIFFGFLEGGVCNNRTGDCSTEIISTEVPTLSEWGLISMAGILGIVGFMFIKRRKVTT